MDIIQPFCGLYQFFKISSPLDDFFVANLKKEFYMDVYINTSLMNQMQRVSKQISTGKQISKGSEDSIKFNKTIDLNSDIQLMSHLQESAEKAKSFAQYTDSALDSMTTGVEEFKSKILAYANSNHSNTSREALLKELDGIKNSLMELSNTKVNGQYLFGGTISNRPPLSMNGEYQGNGENLSIRTDKFQIQEYSINGEDLFLGYDKDIQSSVTTSARKLNQTKLQETPPKEVYITKDDTVEDLTGQNEQVTFYMSGTRPDGSSFTHKFQSYTPSQTRISDIAEEIKLAFDLQVDVSLSKNGQFIITDKESGNPKLNFNMVASTSDVNSLSELEGKEIFSFVENSGSSSIDGEKVGFKKDGNLLTNNIQQFVKEDMSFATRETTLSEVAGKSLNGETLELSGVDINGNAVATTIQLTDNFTYQQLMDEMEALLSGGGDEVLEIELNHKGQFEIRDLTTSQSKLEISIYDSNADDFSSEEGSAISFNSNRALDLDRPSVDIFSSIDDAIEAVKLDLIHPEDGKDNRGIQGSIDNLTHVIDHIVKERAKSGSQLQSINYTLDRSEALKTNMEITQSEVISTDFAEASSLFTALKTNYEAMLMSVAKIQGMTLTNYM
jgi:flagellin-like hook-associated protein FlgL